MKKGSTTHVSATALHAAHTLHAVRVAFSTVEDCDLPPKGKFAGILFIPVESALYAVSIFLDSCLVFRVSRLLLAEVER